MNCPRSHMCWQSKRLYWRGHPGGKQQGKATQENCSATWLAASDFMVMGLVSRLSLASHLLYPIVWLSVLPGGMPISQPRWVPQHKGFWEVDKTYGLASPPSLGSSWILLISFSGSTIFLLETSSCETTQASGYDPPWSNLSDFTQGFPNRWIDFPA